MDEMSSNENETPRTDFLREIVAEDLASGKHEAVVTRFPPEPNGYLHVGHAKSIWVNFSLAAENPGGRCHLRFDDTNPVAEDTRFVEAIKEDLRWLGWDWGEHLYHASDYFEQLYEWAQLLIRDGKAYVCELDEEGIRKGRGTVTEAGTHSPFRDRPAEESLELLERMKNGEREEGSCTLRARIDMAAANMKMRDPLLYRILKVEHPRTGDKWNIYPMYDFAHGQCDALEGITHSICTLEFENNRELYDWFLDNLPVPHRPRQLEFARLNVSHTITSKRRLAQLVKEEHVDGWDDPRMPTVAGMRRRGYTPEALTNFMAGHGISRRDNTVAMAQLEHAVRVDLNMRSRRVMVVLDPVKVTLTNWPEGQVEEVEALNNPEREEDGTRMVPFSGELYLERGDFMEDPPRKFFRLSPGREVRLKHAWFITCDEVVKDEAGEIIELKCSYDPETAGGSAPDGRSPKATLHWVSAAHSVEAEVRLYEKLFNVEAPGRTKADEDFLKELNPDSLKILSGCRAEPSLADVEPEVPLQFLRHGYFTRDNQAEGLVFNRTVSLRDVWGKVQKQGKGKGKGKQGKAKQSDKKQDQDGK
jgi:glutaminyl-tRNA synthetase